MFCYRRIPYLLKLNPQLQNRLGFGWSSMDQQNQIWRWDEMCLCIVWCHVLFRQSSLATQSLQNTFVLIKVFVWHRFICSRHSYCSVITFMLFHVAHFFLGKWWLFQRHQLSLSFPVYLNCFMAVFICLHQYIVYPVPFSAMFSHC